MSPICRVAASSSWVSFCRLEAVCGPNISGVSAGLPKRPTSSRHSPSGWALWAASSWHCQPVTKRPGKPGSGMGANGTSRMAARPPALTSGSQNGC